MPTQVDFKVAMLPAFKGVISTKLYTENSKGQSPTSKQLYTLVKKALEAGVVTFVYAKASGELRVATGTLVEKLLPPTASKKIAVSEAELTQTYYDLGAVGWREFKKENVVAFLAIG